MPSFSSLVTALTVASAFFGPVSTAPTTAPAPARANTTSSGAPAQRLPACGNIHKRHEWRTLSDSQKHKYIEAVKCLQSTPAIKPVIPQAKSRYDEFQAYHIQQATNIHVSGQFLPWHRQYVKSFEDELRNKCGYKEALPYWDWSIDSDSSKPFAHAPVFDPVTGFGGDGVPGTYTLPSPNPPTDYHIDNSSFRGCVQNGPFKDWTVQLGPAKYVGNPHCLTRGIQEGAKEFLNSTAVAGVLALENFELFRVALEGKLPLVNGHRGLHDGGHWGIGGDMSNFYSSPAEPLFYLHHTNLDRIWWRWQGMSPSRLYEISGHSTIMPPYTNVTLDYPLHMDNLGQSVVIRDVMDIHAEPNCYTYV